ncbi:MAG TPA: amidohydrolase [Methylomirabilota bacterium]|nr:amidohydrolase [Methylomirabilota bacterium]
MSSRTPDASDALDPEVSRLAPQLSSVRRTIHQYPEPGFAEVRTAALVAERLRALGLDVRTEVAKTGVVGLLRGAGPGRTLLLRADMDCLPVEEATGAPYASRHPGQMHACGHDGHVAMLLGAAEVLAARRQRLAGAVKFVFQPAEEGPGGAEPMIQSGVLDGPPVDAAVGLHLLNDYPVGTIALRPGPIMAATDRVSLVVRGRGGHGAAPHQTIDAILVAAHLVTALQAISSREVAPTTPVVVTIGTIQGGFRYNVIAPEVALTGTVRSFDPKLRQELPGRIERIARGVAAAFGAEVEADYDFGYPSTVNDPAMTDLVRQAAVTVVGERGIVVPDLLMGGEDMSYFLEAVPGCFAFVGSANPERGLNHPHHSPGFDFDEAALPIGVQVLVRTAERYLAP